MNDNRNYTPAGQPVTQPLYNGQPVYTAPQNPAPVQNPTPAYTYPPQGGNGAPVYAQPVQQPVYYAPVQPPKWADPARLEQKELRRAASRLSFATMTSLPIQVLWTTLATLILTVCGVNLMGPNTIGGFPPTAYYLISSIASFLSIVLPFSFFLFFGKRKLSDTVLVEKNGVLNSVLLVFAGLAVSVLMNIPANLISQLLEGAGLNGDANTADLLALTPVQALTMFVSVVLVAPVTEEFAFRSVTTAVMRRWGDWPAVIFSALIFGMAHYSIQSLPVVLMAGFVMALLYVRTRNIWVNIFVHMLNNLLATLPIALEGLVGTDAANIASNLLTYIVYGLGLIALVVLLIRNFTGHKVFRTPMQRGVPVRGKPYNAMKNRAFVPEEKFMREALSLAEEAFSAGEVPVGAVVVKDGKVIGRGRNRREEHQSVFGHAELEAMEQAAKVLGSWRLTGCTLYVTLEPCPMCAGATVNARVDRIVFGTEDEAMGACGTAVSVTSLKNAFKPELYRGLLCEECTAILRRFFKARRAERTEK